MSRQKWLLGQKKFPPNEGIRIRLNLGELPTLPPDSGIHPDCSGDGQAGARKNGPRPPEGLFPRPWRGERNDPSRCQDQGLIGACYVA